MNRTIKELVPGLVYDDLRSVTDRELSWEKLDGKQILITGANGFIGYYLVMTCLLRNDLYHSNIRVVGLVRSLEHAKSKYGEILDRSDFCLCVQDVCGEITLEHADYVIHAASQASARYFAEDPVGTMNANLLGTRSVLELARRCRATILLISSLKVYGSFADSSKDAICEEEMGYLDPVSFRNCYAMGKRAAETLGASYSAQYGVPVKIVRPSYIYGPTIVTDDRVWAQFMVNVMRRENIVLKSSGAVIRSYCYVTDTAAAMFTVLLDGKEMYPYNISSRESSISIRNLARAALTAFPERNLGLTFANLADGAEPDPAASPREILDNARLVELGWDAKVSPVEGMRRGVMIMEQQKKLP